MGEQTLLTLLQISDLHFGDAVAGGGTMSLDAMVPPFLPTFRILDGLLGHHYAALVDLHRFAAELLRQRAEVVTIVSGDVTATGSSAQFATADGYLGQRRSHSAFGLGLGLIDWPDQAVPGNHDNWPGTGGMFGPPTADLRTYFPGPYPIIHDLVPLGCGYQLRVILVDSDAEGAPYSVNRFMGRGSFLAQLQVLERRLPRAEPGEIRVLVVHHAIVTDDVSEQAGALPYPRRKARPPRVLEIDDPTLRVLEHLLVDGGIQVVMTGHLHVPRLTEILANNGAATANVFEARCGTTTQLDRYPYGLRRWMGSRRLLPPNTLIVHDILLRDDAPIWRAQIYWRSPQRGFVADVAQAAWARPRHMSRELKLVVPHQRPG